MGGEKWDRTAGVTKADRGSQRDGIRVKLSICTPAVMRLLAHEGTTVRAKRTDESWRACSQNKRSLFYLLYPFQHKNRGKEATCTEGHCVISIRSFHVCPTG